MVYKCDRCKHYEFVIAAPVPNKETPGSVDPADPTTANPEHDLAAKRQQFACKTCDKPVVHKVVKKDGQNKGRTFYKCDRCEHYEFVTAAPVPNKETPGSVDP